MHSGNISGTSLAAQWLRLRTSSTGGMGSIPGLGTKIPYAMWHGQKKEILVIISVVVVVIITITFQSQHTQKKIKVY